MVKPIAVQSGARRACDDTHCRYREPCAAEIGRSFRRVEERVDAEFVIECVWPRREDETFAP